MNIYEILESHTIIEWLSRMNVKDEYVKPHSKPRRVSDR